MPTEEDYKRIKGIADAGFSRGMSIPQAIKTFNEKTRVLQYGRSADPAWQAEHDKEVADYNSRVGKDKTPPDYSGVPAGGSLKGVWGAIQQELSGLRNTPFMNRMGEEIGFGTKLAGKVAVGTAKALTSDYSAEDPNRSAGPRPNTNRYREMAGLPPDTMKAAHGPGTGSPVPTTTPGPQEAMPRVGEAMKDPATGKTASPGVSRETTRAATPSAPAGGYSDPRQRYIDMANRVDKMDLEQRNKFADEQGLIETIRGTDRGYWNPKYPNQEFKTAAEAATGVDAAPSEKGGIELEKAKIAAGADVEGAKIRAQAVRDASRIAADAAIQKGSKAGNDEWTYHETPDGDPFILEKKGGRTLPIYLDEPSKAAGVLQSIGLGPEDLAFGASVLEKMPREVRNEAFKLLNPDRKKAYYDILEKRSKKNKKGPKVVEAQNF